VPAYEVGGGAGELDPDAGVRVARDHVSGGGGSSSDHVVLPAMDFDALAVRQRTRAGGVRADVITLDDAAIATQLEARERVRRDHVPGAADVPPIVFPPAPPPSSTPKK